jgi:hypothetical protein
MSYDLYLYRRPAAKALKKKEFQTYFKDRPNFTVKGTTAGYENEKTGVYFSFNYSDGKGAEADDEIGCRAHVHFNLNYFRSHVFGLEAERVLTPFVEALDLIVSDPQTEGMGDGDYTPEGFLRGWNAGNRFAHGAMLSLQDKGETLLGGQHTLPAKTLRACWEWTFGIDDLYERVQDDNIDVFIPRVMYALCDGALRTFCVWPQLIPTALPAVDVVLVMRNELPQGAQGGETGNAVVAWNDVRKAASKFKLVPGKATAGLQYVLMDYGTAEEAPPELVSFVRDLPAFAGQLQGISLDRILDDELVRAAAPGAK